MSPSLPTLSGEEYFQVALPNYDKEHLLLTASFIVAGIFWLFVFPLVSSVERRVSISPELKHQRDANTKNLNRQVVPLTTKKGGRQNTFNEEAKGSQRKTSSSSAGAVARDDNDPNTRVREVPLLMNILACCFLCLTVALLLAFFSSHNTFLPRTVFQAPLLTKEECATMLDIAHSVAQRNYQRAMKELNSTSNPANTTTGMNYVNHTNLWNTNDQPTLEALLREPLGWQKTRHTTYPTTDLNLVTDPFSADERRWIASLLDRRLGPILSRLHGIPTQSIRANDMFIVRYDGQEGQRQALAKHTDDGYITVNILLNAPNTSFVGGGTRFFNRRLQLSSRDRRQHPHSYRKKDDNGVFAHVEPQHPGQMATFHAQLLHEGYPVTSGTRIILVGFLSVDWMDPFTRVGSGLSWYASWLSFAWLHNRFKEGYEWSETVAKQSSTTKKTQPPQSAPSSVSSFRHSPIMRSLLRDVVEFLIQVVDYVAPHDFKVLVPEEQSEDFLHALDRAYYAQQEALHRKASWFRGQQISLDLDGTIAGLWPSRKQNQAAFEEL